VAQLIAWQDGKYEDAQFCAPREVSLNRIIAVKNDPDLGTLRIPTIDDNRNGSMTLWIAPLDVVHVTLRIIGPRQTLVAYAPRLSAVNISSVFASQIANTGETQLITDKTLLVDDRTPPSVTLSRSPTFEAEGPAGSLVPQGFVQAERNGAAVPVVCDPELPRQIGLDIFNSPPGPTTIDCTATTDNGVTTALSQPVFVLDTTPPSFDAGTVPTEIREEAVPSGTEVNYTPTATDYLGVDPNVEVTCSPASGSKFPIGTTPVNCTATDDSLNSVSTSFNVIIEDTTGPVIGDFDPPDFEPPLIDKFVLDDDRSTFQLYWGPFTVTDADAMPTVMCNVGELDATRSDPANGLYTFFYEFPVGQTLVVCTATDVDGNETNASFPVVVFDETAPTITLLGDPEITIEKGDSYSDPGATVTDNVTASGDIVVDIDASAVDTDTEGSYSVVITATDESGNTATAVRTVIVKFVYADGTGIVPKKLIVNLGSSNGLLWGWLGDGGNLVDVSGDMQILRIREGSCSGPIVFEMAGDPGTSGFRFKNTFEVQFNWQVEGEIGKQYCAEAESSRTGQRQYSPLMRIE